MRYGSVASNMRLTSIEVCSGAGGQALGLEQAGFEHLALVEIDSHACNTLRFNRPSWNVIEDDIKNFSAHEYDGVDLLAAGVPCPPFSVAGKQLGQADERDLFPEILRLVAECHPKAVMIENVRGLLNSVFDEYRADITQRLEGMGYRVSWKLLQASDFGVPQLRPRVVVVALQEPFVVGFEWPTVRVEPPTVGDVLYPLMKIKGWEGADDWKQQAHQIAPTLVGGSKKHGGPDLGPTRAKRSWERLGVDGHGLANEPPSSDFVGVPRLTVEMTAMLQGFPKSWVFTGRKTAAYRQVGNAFPPPVAKAVGQAIAKSLENVPEMGEGGASTWGQEKTYESIS